MSTATIILWIAALVLVLLSWRRGLDVLKSGLVSAWKITRRNSLIIVIAFIIVGFVEILSPTQLITNWIGPNTGLSGLLIAEFVGMLLPGGPYVVFPLIAILGQSGAGLGAIVTLITSWSTQSLLTISFELPFMGWRFTAIRWTIGLIIPLLAGVLTNLIWG